MVLDQSLKTSCRSTQASEGVVHRGWMDFGGAFESDFGQIRRFILVVWAKKQAGHEAIAARKAASILFLSCSWARVTRPRRGEARPEQSHGFSGPHRTGRYL